MRGSRGVPEEGDRPRRWLPDLLGLAWVLVAAGAVMAPSLVHGVSLGPFDQLARYGLLQPFQHGAKPLVPASVHNTQLSDLFREMIPWTNLAWTQVHHGFLPLWNPYSGLGAPLAFNWQSAAASLPALVGYLFPVRLDFTVQVLITLAVAGTGTYVFARVLRLGVLGAAMAATVFELSGSFMALLGWPITSTMSWAGWMFALALLIVRGHHRRRDIVLFAVVVALAIYAGQPDTLIVLVVGLAVFVVVMLGIRVRRWKLPSIGRPVLGLSLGSIAGIGLAAPLLLPGSQLLSGSVRGTGQHGALPAHDLLHLILQTFNGSFLSASVTFDTPGVGYVATAAFIGVFALVLAGVGVVARRRQPGVAALGAVLLTAVCLVYLPELVWLIRALGFGAIRWIRAIQVLVFAFAVLSGVGLDVLVRSHNSRAVRNGLGAGFASVGAVLLIVWTFGRGHLPNVEAAIRNKSFLWPTVEVLIGLFVFGLLVLFARFRSSSSGQQNRWWADPARMAGVVLLVCSTGFLVALNAPWWPSSSSYLKPTPTVTALKRAVGNSTVGFGGGSCFFPPTLGIPANVNVAFGIHELDSYDPLTPELLFTSWELETKTFARPLGYAANAIPVSTFCPTVQTVSAARLFGVEYVLEFETPKAPPGSVFVARIGNEKLYRIPGVSLATLTPIKTLGQPLPPIDASGTPVSVAQPTPSSWSLHTNASTPQVLRLRLTDVPGFHASLDGKPLPLTRFAGIMLQAKIPPGPHTIEVHYWPDTFNVGIVIAACTVVLTAAVLLVDARRRRTRHP